MVFQSVVVTNHLDNSQLASARREPDGRDLNSLDRHRSGALNQEGAIIGP